MIKILDGDVAQLVFQQAQSLGMAASGLVGQNMQVAFLRDATARIAVQHANGKVAVVPWSVIGRLVIDAGIEQPPPEKQH